MSLIKSSVCDKIARDLDDLLNEIEDFRNDVIGDIEHAIEEIRDVITPNWDMDKVDKAIHDINKDIRKIVPYVEDFNELLNILSECFYLQISPLSDPSILAAQTLDDLKRRAMKEYQKIADIPEMLLNEGIQNLIDMIPAFGIDLSAFGASQLLKCLESMCGVTGLEASYARLHNALTDLCMDHVGAFVPYALYRRAGLNEINPLDAQIMSGLDYCRNAPIAGINDVYRSIESNCNKAIENFKNLPDDLGDPSI